MVSKEGPGRTNGGAVLSGRQAALVDALGDRDELVTFYLGARRVLQDEANPDRHAQAAHSIRELLEKVPEYFDVPLGSAGRTMKSEAKNLSKSWSGAIKRSACHTNGEWSGAIDGTLLKFLKKAASFFEWLQDERPPRTEQARAFMRKSDPSPQPMPETIEEIRLSEWNAYRDFFVSVAHHRQDAVDEFERWMVECEDFLLKQLAPRTWEDRGAIREIVERAEGRAH